MQDERAHLCTLSTLHSGWLTSQVLLGVGHKAMGVKLFLVGRMFLARGEHSWLGGTLATFGAVFSRAPYRITRLPKGVRGAPPTKVRRRRKLAKMTKVQEKKTRFCTVKRAVSLLQAFPQGTYSLAGLQEAKGSSGGLGHGGQPAGALGVSGPLDPP